MACLNCLNASISSQWVREVAYDASIVGKLYLVCFFAALLGSTCIASFYVNATLEQKRNSDVADCDQEKSVEKEHVVEVFIEGAENYNDVLAYMLHFGIPERLPQHVCVKRYTREELLQVKPTDENGLQAIILVALDEDDEEACHTMHVRLSLYENARTLSIILTLSALSLNAYDDYFTQCMMLENFMQAVCDFCEEAHNDDNDDNNNEEECEDTVET